MFELQLNESEVVFFFHVKLLNNFGEITNLHPHYPVIIIQLTILCYEY